MTLAAIVSSAVESWAAFYGDHQMVSVTVRYLHLAGLVTGAGTALATDRRILGVARSEPSERAALLPALRASHRVVMPALALVMLTGALMTASDTGTFFASRLYWSKMGLVALLLLNGLGLLAAERAAARERANGWRWLVRVSAVSLVLWLVILFAGVWLTVAA